jgi:ParB family chromosome partitioning protein
MADYRADAVSLDQLMALPSPTTTPRRKPRSTMRRNGSATPHLRERLTEREIDAYRHPLVRFVGLDTYEPQAVASAATCSRKAMRACI